MGVSVQGLKPDFLLDLLKPGLAVRRLGGVHLVAYNLKRRHFIKLDTSLNIIQSLRKADACKISTDLTKIVTILITLRILWLAESSLGQC